MKKAKIAPMDQHEMMNAYGDPTSYYQEDEILASSEKT